MRTFLRKPFAFCRAIYLKYAFCIAFPPEELNRLLGEGDYVLGFFAVYFAWTCKPVEISPRLRAVPCLHRQ
jgi:hypothetical protein